MSILQKLPIFLLAVALAECIPFPRDLSEEFALQKADAAKIDYRLPQDVVPSAYTIKLNPYLEGDKKFTFDGESVIAIEVKKETKSITLHALKLKFDETKTRLAYDNNTSSFPVAKQTLDADRQVLVIEFKDALKVDKYKLFLQYTGELAEDLYGFYRSSYKDSDGKDVWLATTHFEPTSARRAFPCFDEPALKSTFQISIKHLEKHHAISNMPVYKKDSIDNADNKSWTHFEPTQEMSTYLVAFVVSDFKFLEKKVGPRTYRIYAKPPAIQNGEYAKSITAETMEALEEYTGIKYTFPKMDQIAIPHFSAGAMENWGLVTYREASLLYEEGVSTSAAKEAIATVIAHEFTHQWFGNLVSPKWWEYVWLNEGFATYLQYYITDKVEKNWNLMEKMVVERMQSIAFPLDSKATSHPMNQPVESPKEIKDLFDQISYGKAGSVIRMMSNVLTDKVFGAGLKYYLEDRKYKEATSDDLLAGLQKAATESKLKIDVKATFDPWFKQMGFPLLTVTRNYTSGELEVTQQRFLTTEPLKNDTHDYKWPVPVNYVLEGDKPDFTDTTPEDWLLPTETKLLKAGFSGTKWLILNKQQTGYYRVNYDAENWEMLGEYLNSSNYDKIHVINRANLIDDALNLARYGHLSYNVTFKVLSYLPRDNSYTVWYPTFQGLTYLKKIMTGSSEYERFKVFVQGLLEGLDKALGYEEKKTDSHRDKLLRVSSLALACEFDVGTCRNSTEQQLGKWLSDSTKNPLPANLRTGILCGGLRQAPESTWEKTLKKYRESKDETLKTVIVTALGCSADEGLLNRYLELSVSEESADAVPAAARTAVLTQSAEGVNVVLDFVVNNADNITKIDGGVGNLKSLLSAIGERVTTQKQLDKLNSVKLGSGNVTAELNLSVESAKLNLEWLSKYEPNINAWLEENVVSQDGPKPTEPSTKPNSNGVGQATVSILASMVTMVAVLLLN